MTYNRPPITTMWKVTPLSLYCTSRDRNQQVAHLLICTVKSTVNYCKSIYFCVFTIFNTVNNMSVSLYNFTVSIFFEFVQLLGTTGTIFITSLVWCGPWLGIELGTSRIRSQHSTTRLSRRRYFFNESELFDKAYETHITLNNLL